ncbi:hypothetical protein [Bradyrhizobium sp. LeoA1S1]
MLKTDRTVTYLQCLYPHDRPMETVVEMRNLFPGEVLQHLEFIRFGGRVTCSGLPVVRYTNADRLNEIISLHEAHGVNRRSTFERRLTMLESPDPDAIVDMSRKIEMHMPSDRPGMIMRRRLLELFRAHGEEEQPKAEWA